MNYKYLRFRQVCSINIESFAYDMEDVNFKWNSPAIDLANNIELPQFKLKGYKTNAHCNRT